MFEPVKCSHCCFEFRTDIAAIIKEGNVAVARKAVRDEIGEPEARTIKTIDLTCPKCNKRFKHTVRP